MSLSAMWEQSHSWRQYWKQDLLPTPGRLHSSLRITLTSVIVLIVMMTLRMPQIAFGLYAIFLMARGSPAVTVRAGIMLLISVGSALGIVLLIVVVTDNSPMARILGVIAMTFVAAMITAATTLPSGGSGWGLIFCVAIAFWENHVPEDALVKNMLWVLAAFFTGILASIAVEYVFASRSPVETLADALRMRHQALEAMFHAYAQDGTEEQRQKSAERVSQLAAAGSIQLLTLYAQIVDRDLERGDLPVGVHTHITILAELLDSAAAFGLGAECVDSVTQTRCSLIAQRCSELARKLRTKETWRSAAEDAAESTYLDRVETMLGWIESISPRVEGDHSAFVAIPSKQVPFFIPGAMHKWENLSYALKISLCATVAYVIYHAIDWPGISTAVITVMVAGLSHTGAMKQKLSLRFLGTTLGGLLLGIGSEVFLFPFMDSITSLVVLIGAIAFVCAWISGGSRFGYFGIQTAFAFYLTTLAGFSAPTELAAGRDRFIGILLGVIVMWLVLDQVWPVRTTTVMRRALVSVLQDAARVIALVDSELPPASYRKESNSLRDRLGKQLATLRSLNQATDYEFGINHRESMDLGDKFLRISMTTVALVWNHATLRHQEEEKDFLRNPSLIGLRKVVAERLASIADVLARPDFLNALDSISLTTVQAPSDERQSEYAINVVSRYNELNALVVSLRATT